ARRSPYSVTANPSSDRMNVPSFFIVLRPLKSVSILAARGSTGLRRRRSAVPRVCGSGRRETAGRGGEYRLQLIAKGLDHRDHGHGHEGEEESILRHGQTVLILQKLDCVLHCAS